MALFLFSITMPHTTIYAQEDPLSPEAQEAMNRGLSAARQQEWELAIKYFSEARRAANDSRSAMFNLAMAYDKAGRYELLAITWYRAYLAAASAARDLQPQNQKVRERVTDLEVKAEANIQRLIQRAKEMVAAGHPSSHGGWYDMEVRDYGKETADRRADNEWRSWRYQKIAEAQARIGDIDGARATVAGISDRMHPVKDSAYADIAGAQARVWDFAGAKVTAARIINDRTREVAYSEIARLQADADDSVARRAGDSEADRVRSERFSWEMVLPFEGVIFPDWQTFSASLKNKKPDEAADAVIEVVKNLAESFLKIRVNEAIWKRLRTQANR